MKKRASFKKGFTLVEVLVVVGIVGMLARIAIPGTLRSRATANAAIAQSNLRSYSDACTIFLATTGRYPTTEDELTAASPPYLSKPWDAVNKNGFSYNITLAAGGYDLIANAVASQGGSWNYRMTTGPVLMRQPQSGGTWVTF